MESPDPAASPDVTFEVADATSADATWALGEYYAELDERFPTGFDAGPDTDGPKMVAPTGMFVLIRRGDEVLGCGGIQRLPTGEAEIKRMWIAPIGRGQGLGKRLLAHLEQGARDLGHTVVRLDTNSTLLEAISMYAGAGYAEIDRYNNNPFAKHWYEKSLVAVDNEAELR